MRLLKVLCAMALVFTLGACSGEKSDDKIVENELKDISIITPMGATALSMLGLYGDEHVTIDTVDGADALAAELNKKDGYDAIVAPINLGAKLISTGKSEYVLHSVVTWGNLYIIGSHEHALEQEGIFAAFGEKAVPQKVLTSAIDMNTIVPQVQYFNSVQDVQAQLLTGKATCAMIAEPAATATIAKAKEKGIQLQVLKNLQKEYKEENNTATEGFPQAALFVKKSSLKSVDLVLDKAITFVNETALKDEQAIIDAVQSATVEKLGIPNAQIAAKTWTRQNIRFVKASEVEKDIATFLKTFNIKLDKKYIY